MTQQNSPQQRGGFMGRGPGRGPVGGPGRGPMGGGPMHGAMMGGEKPKSFRKTMQTFLTYLKPFL